LAPFCGQEKDLREAIGLDSSYKVKTQKDPKFNSIKNHPDFVKPVGKYNDRLPDRLEYPLRRRRASPPVRSEPS